MSKLTLPLLSTALYLSTMLALVVAPPVAAQGLGGLLKKKLKAKVEEVTARAADQATAKLEEVIRCAIGDAACLRKAKEEGKRVILFDGGAEPAARGGGEEAPAAAPSAAPPQTPPEPADAGAASDTPASEPPTRTTTTTAQSRWEAVQSWQGTIRIEDRTQRSRIETSRERGDLYCVTEYVVSVTSRAGGPMTLGAVGAGWDTGDSTPVEFSIENSDRLTVRPSGGQLSDCEGQVETSRAPEGPAFGNATLSIDSESGVYALSLSAVANVAQDIHAVGEGGKGSTSHSVVPVALIVGAFGARLPTEGTRLSGQHTDTVTPPYHNLFPDENERVEERGEAFLTLTWDLAPVGQKSPIADASPDREEGPVVVAESADSGSCQPGPINPSGRVAGRKPPRMPRPLGSSIGTKKTLAQRVVEYGVANVGKTVPGPGECWDLPFEALKYAGAKTPYDFGDGTDYYVWGQKIDDLKDAQPGDILQFWGVRITQERQWVTGEGEKQLTHSKRETFNFGEKHSAIVERVDPDLVFTTLNVHINKSTKVQRLVIDLSPENIKTGRIDLYRPVASSPGQ